MRILKKIILSIALFTCFGAWTQTNTYYLYLNDANNAPSFTEVNNKLVYSGNDKDMRTFFSKYTITGFYQAFPEIPDQKILKVFILETPERDLADDLLVKYPGTFLSYDDITNSIVESLVDYYPNDYGITSPVPNTGAAVDRKELDYLNAPEAWGENTGNSNILIGISDTGIDDSLPDLMNKTSYVSGYSGSGSHGTNVASIAAAQGDNSDGSVGICYDCDLIAASTGIGSTSNLAFSRVYQLAKDGARVINMSWCNWCYITDINNGGSQVEQDVIDYIRDTFGTVFVAAAGNRSSYSTPSYYHDGNGDGNPDTPFGTLYVYPAAYDNVISVSTVYHHNAALDANSYYGDIPMGPLYLNIQDGVSAQVIANDINNPIGVFYNGYALVWQHTLNDDVDILATGRDIFQYYSYEHTGDLYGNGTSYSAPFVSGTIGLMIENNDCLHPDDVEAILKLTSKDIEHDLTADDTQPASLNQNFYGEIGAGKLEIGKSVKFVKEMSDSNGNAVIKDHIFHRFSFSLDNILNKLTIDNSRFVEESSANFVAKNIIELLPGTLLEPDSGAFVELNIDSSISACVPSASRKFGSNDNSKESEESDKDMFVIAPTIIDNITYVSKSEKLGEKIHAIAVYNLLGLEISTFRNINNYKAEINLNQLKSGVYVVKVLGENNQILHTQKIIKK